MPATRSSARVDGVITRGMTHQNRLRRGDRWILAHAGAALKAAREPLVVDLGFGRVAQTTIELFQRLQELSPATRVVGLEIDPARVAEARQHERPGLTFARGGFELAGLEGVAVIRAMNVLRQYDASAVSPAWAQLAERLAPGGILLEGTCDELGRLGSWVVVRAHSVVPEELVFSAQVSSLGDPARFAERLPKALIHRNVAGEGIHEFLAAWSREWAGAAHQAPFGPRARFVAAAAALKRKGVPLRSGPARWRLGELSVDWSVVAPRR